LEIIYSEKKKNIINRINYLIFVVYALVILEGAIRKWVLPQFSSALFFIKDPFVIYIYFLAFHYKLFPRNFYFVLTMLLALLFYFLMSLQSLLIPFNILAGIYGWRTYFFFLPLAFIIAEHYGQQELKRVARFTCLIAIPIAVLTFIQYKSSADSYINRSVGLGESNAYTVIEDIVRPSGTFSFTTGQATFVSTLLLMLLYNFFMKKKDRFLNPLIFCLCIFAFFANLAVSGSRASYVGILIILLFLLFASFILLNKKQGFNILIYLSLGLVMSFMIFDFIFYKEWDIITRRQEMAETEEGSIFSRMLDMFITIDFFKATNPPLLGYGLGLSSGGGSFLVTGKSSFGLAETDWARNVLEAGLLLGTAYIFYRVFLTIHIVNDSIRSMIKSKNPIPFIFLGFLVPSLLVGSITGNGTSNIYNWLFVGFSMALNRVYLKGDEVNNMENDY
jgi:hypothetical protein